MKIFNFIKKFKIIILDVIRSAIGTVIWIIVIIGWNITFQLLRTKMGPIGDFLTFVSPRGYY